jgi:hypothetical protein
MTKQERIEELEAQLAELKKATPWEDLGKVYGFWINERSESTSTGKETTQANRNVFATKEQAESFGVVAAQLTQLIQVARNGWEPDWSDEKQKKYAPYLERSGLCIYVVTRSVLSFSLQTRELLADFIKQHQELLTTYFKGTTS